MIRSVRTPRRDHWWRAAVTSFGLCLGALISASPVAAQSGGLFLLVPFGAKAVALGNAVSGDTTLGAEGLWWNPAALARQSRRELALHHSQTVLSTSEMFTLAIPSRVLGSLALGAYAVDYGDQQATDQYTGQPTGVITNRNYLLAASYATPVGAHAGLGVTYKFLMLRFACSGACGNTPVISGSTSAIDVGAQYRLPVPLPITLGASVRNLGPNLQMKDKPQADPLPRLIQVGAVGRVPWPALTAAGAALDIHTDLLQGAALGGTAVGIGAALGYREQVFLRAGYKTQPGEGGGPSIGFGVQRGAFAMDLARHFDRLSSTLGEPPTYVTLRLAF